MTSIRCTITMHYSGQNHVVRKSTWIGKMVRLQTAACSISVHTNWLPCLALDMVYIGSPSMKPDLAARNWSHLFPAYFSYWSMSNHSAKLLSPPARSSSSCIRPRMRASGQGNSLHVSPHIPRFIPSTAGFSSEEAHGLCKIGEPARWPEKIFRYALQTANSK